MLPKFRAWDKTRNLMIDEIVVIDLYHEYIGYLYSSEIVQGEIVSRLPINDVIIMQSTGLLDKNGVEIYTGDILDIKANFKRLGFVIFDRGKFKVQHVEDTAFYDFTQVLSQCEVIGNVFENKELLETMK